MKPDSIKSPDAYLGNTIKKEFNPITKNSIYSMGSEKYVKEAIRVIMTKDKTLGISSKSRGLTPFSSATYRPELDYTHFCPTDRHHLYQQAVGSLHWIIELGWIDISHETSLLSHYLDSPREGHLQQAINVFKYLEGNINKNITFNTDRIDIEWSNWERDTAMKKLYPDTKEEIPSDSPKPRGKEIQLNGFVDADFAGDKLSRCSYMGIIIYGNMSPLIWYSKKKNTIETSTFGDEFVALRIATELIISLRYKLRMMGVPIEEPAQIFCNNEAVVKNSAFPESSIKRKHLSIAYHKVRETIAANTILLFMRVVLLMWQTF